AELHAYAWERLLLDRDGSEVAVACSPEHPLSRYTGLALAEPRALRKRGERLRLLVAVSNPTKLPDGFARIDVRQELEDLVAVLQRVDGLTVTLLPGRTAGSAEEFGDFAAKKAEWEEAGFEVAEGPISLPALGQAFEKNDIVHFLGHGIYATTK